jgi:hypothetical protein
MGRKNWSPKVGPHGTPTLNTIRIMPPHENMVDEKGEPKVFVRSRVHFRLGPNKDTGSACLRYWNEECPACVFRETLYAQAKQIPPSDPQAEEKVKVLKDYAYEIRPQDRWGCNLVDLSTAQIRGVQSYFFGVEISKKLDRCFFGDPEPGNPGGDFIDVSHPETGRNILMRVQKKAGGSQFNEYPELRAAQKPSALHDMTWLDQVEDLSWHEYRPTRAEAEATLQGRRYESRNRGAARPAPSTATGPSMPPPSPVSPSPASSVPPLVPAQTPAPAKTKMPGRKKKDAPANGAEAPAVPTALWATGLAQLARLAPDFTPTAEQQAVTPGQLQGWAKANDLPPCFEKDLDTTDVACRQCPVIVPCSTAIAAKS